MKHGCTVAKRTPNSAQWTAAALAYTPLRLSHAIAAWATYAAAYCGTPVDCLYDHKRSLSAPKS